MRLKRIGAMLMGAVMLGSTLAPASAGIPPERSFWVGQDGAHAAIIVVGDEAAASDVVSASLIAAKVGTMAIRVEEIPASKKIYTDYAIDIPLAYSIESWRETIPWQIFNIGPYGGIETGTIVGPNYPPATPGLPPAFDGEAIIYYYKTWGVTTHWTPSDNAYVIPDFNFKFFNGVRVEYTLGSLWFYDEDSRCWFFTRPDGIFQPWETHEEIQIRFDDLYMVGGKEFRLSGIHFQDHRADLLGGNVVPESFWSMPNPPTYLVPGLIYRIDNIRRPPQIGVSGNSLVSPIDPVFGVGTHAMGTSYYYMPEPHAIARRLIPRIRAFGKEYKVVDATFLWDYDNRYMRQATDWNLGDSYVIITGEPRFYLEQYLYKDQPQNFDGYEILVNDTDRDHNKILLSITTPSGDTFEFWMIINPRHGFSATLPQISEPGGITEYTGWSLNDVWVVAESIMYRDEDRHSHLQYTYPVFVLDGISTFVGEGGVIGALFNIYTLTDVVEFKTRLCCAPYVTEPADYSLWIDQQSTGDPCLGNYFNPSLIAMGQTGSDHPNGPGPLGETVPGTNASLSYEGPWWSVDSHCTTAPGIIPPSIIYDDSYSYSHFIESIADGYMDIDRNDFVWLYENGFNMLNNSPMPVSQKNLRNWDSFSQIDPEPESGGNFPITKEATGLWGADYMWEMNFALCDVSEAVNCTTKWVIVGPNNYFSIEMSDITWDDDGNGWAYKWFEPVWVEDQLDDGIDFRVVMEVSSGNYRHSTPLAFDPPTIVKLDVEVTEDDMVSFNLVLVGGPAVNRLVRRLVEEEKIPHDGSDVEWMRILSDFKLYRNGFGKGRDVLVVAGPDREGTRTAAEELVSNMK